MDDYARDTTSRENIHDNDDLEHDPWNQQVRNLIAGTAGGWSQTIVGHPFDTIKVRMQTAVGGANASLLECLQSTMKNGVHDFYLGIASPLLGQGLMNALQYATYGNMKILCGGCDRDTIVLPPERYLIVGALTGAVISTVDGPVDLFKIKLQVQGQTGTNYKGVIDAMKQIYGTFGIRGVYQGFGATLMRNIPCNGLYFATYEYVRQYFVEKDDVSHISDLSPSRLLAAGGAAGFAYWSILYPVETVKSAMQGDASDPAKRRYRNWIDCGRKVYQQNGYQAFWRGWLPCVIRSVPANAACFYAYETTRQMLMDLPVSNKPQKNFTSEVQQQQHILH
eukprot:CAMPEP_0194249360 /NCGR_PEP_ID=MMETSP0158-20130606/20291_1 /TAXON_ID=33649 /ORGANISM="Thalassionema nitzschioides, Strain L26-B" /LENGTH=336 /DNA_ID=CAMNT_0038985861 /DNA_START=45 /DNA_END=1055 /DNA_ORIENTATION=+